MECVFCSIVSERTAEIVFEDENTLAFMDINPATRGHLLVIPKAHRRDIWEVEEQEAAAVMRTAWRVVRWVKNALEPDGLNLVQANGRPAFQDVFHFHFHVIPRYENDRIVKPWESVPGDEDDIRRAAQLIRQSRTDD